jgi:hypothetical protein
MRKKIRHRIKNLEDLVRLWKWRDLSLKGKISVINNLAISSLIYICSVTSVPKRVVKEVNTLLFDFLWNGGSHKIASTVITQNIQDGGLKMVDFESKVKSLKISWLNRILSPNKGNWKKIIEYFYKSHDLEFIFSCKLPKPPNGLPLFYNDMHSHWLKIHNVEPFSNKHILNEIIWNNKFITINRMPYLWENWKRAGIMYIRDIVKDNNDFLSHNEIQQKYDLQCNFLSVLQVRQSIPLIWRNEITSTSGNVNVNIIKGCVLHVNNDITPLHIMSSKNVYWVFIEKFKRVPTCVQSWNEHYNINLDTWKIIFKIPFICTRETKLQTFQYRLLHRIIQCNKWLFQLRIVNSGKCNYCEQEDTLLHFFMDCNKVDRFWHAFFPWWNIANDGKQNIFQTTEMNILFGYTELGEIYPVLNFCLLLAKFYIYTKRLYGNNRLDLYEYLVILKNKLTIEKLICENEGKPEKFKKWEIIFNNL